MSTTVIPPTTQTSAAPVASHDKNHQFKNPHFQQVYDKWGNHQFEENQIYNQNYLPTGEASNDLEVLFNNVMRDPRFNRLRVRWNPKMSDEGGVKQKVKNVFDPVHIPYVGAAVAWSRASRAGDAKQKLDKIQEDNQGNLDTQTKEVLDTMQNNAKVNTAGLTAKASAKTFFMFFPVVFAVPAGDQALSKVAEKAASKGAQKSAQAAVDEGAQDNAKADVNEAWGNSKAFLIYLGAPRTEDPIYQTWEDSRIQLKQFFGCSPQEDVQHMEPKGEDLKQIEEAESNKGGYDLNAINVPLLVLLWRIYECWDDQYADKLTSEKHKMNKEKRFRTEDERQVLEMISPIDSHVQRLNESSAKEIARLFRAEHPMAYGKHSMFSFLDEKSESKREKRLSWMLKTFIGNLLKAKLGWGFFSDPTNTGKQGELLAVLFFERAEQDHYEPSDVLKTFSGMMKLKTDYPNISRRLGSEDSIMKNHIGNNEDNYPGIVHYYGCINSPEGMNALSILLRSQINYTSIPSYVQEYSGETERIKFLESLGFKKAHRAEDQDKQIDSFDFIPATRQDKDYIVPPLSNQNANLKHA